MKDLQQQVSRQAIINKQRRYLKSLDRKEREYTLVVLGVPEEHEALNGATTARDKVA